MFFFSIYSFDNEFGNLIKDIDVSNAKSYIEKVANEWHVAKQQGNKEEVDDDKELGHLIVNINDSGILLRQLKRS